MKIIGEAPDVRRKFKRRGSIGRGDPLEFGAERIDLPSQSFVGKSVSTQLAIKFIHSGSKIVLQLEIGEQLIEQIEFDTVIPWISPDLAGIGDFCARNELLHAIANVANLVVLRIAADIDRLVVNPLFRRIHEGNEGAGDVPAMNERPPRRSVGHDADLAGRDGAGQ